MRSMLCAPALLLDQHAMVMVLEQERTADEHRPPPPPDHGCSDRHAPSKPAPVACLWPRVWGAVRVLFDAASPFRSRCFSKLLLLIVSKLLLGLLVRRTSRDVLSIVPTSISDCDFVLLCSLLFCLEYRQVLQQYMRRVVNSNKCLLSPINFMTRTRINYPIGIWLRVSRATTHSAGKSSLASKIHQY